jgi:hypothetical protein
VAISTLGVVSTLLPDGKGEITSSARRSRLPDDLLVMTQMETLPPSSQAPGPWKSPLPEGWLPYIVKLTIYGRRGVLRPCRAARGVGSGCRRCDTPRPTRLTPCAPPLWERGLSDHVIARSGATWQSLADFSKHQSPVGAKALFALQDPSSQRLPATPCLILIFLRLGAIIDNPNCCIRSEQPPVLRMNKLTF